MAQQLINIGTTANDGTGDTLRAAFDKINENFTEVYSDAETAVEVLADTTPQLGGNLDVNGKLIVSTSNGNISIQPNGTGSVITDNIRIGGGSTSASSRTITTTVTNGSLYLAGNGTGAVDIQNIRGSGGYVDNVVIGGNVRAAGSFTNISASGNATVTGNLTVTGNINLGNDIELGSITVNEVADITGNLRVSGADNRFSSQVKIGSNTAPQYLLDIGNNVSQTSSIIADSQVHILNADNHDTRLFLESFGLGFRPIITGRQAAGIASAPEATQAAQTLLSLTGRGYDGTNWTLTKAGIEFESAETYTSSSTGTQIKFYTTPVGATTLQESVRITPTGRLLVFDTNNSTLPSNGSFVTSGGIGVAKDIHGGGDLHVLGDVYAQTNLIINGRAQFEEIDISYNRIEATVSNGNVRLVPNGTGRVIVAGTLQVDDDLVMFGTATIDGLEIGNNSIESLSTNGPLNLISNGTGKINLLGQVRYVNVNVPGTSVGQVGDEEGDLAVNGSYFYYCTGDYDGSTNIWKRIQWSGDTW